MSFYLDFENDKSVEDLELFNPDINRTIDTRFDLPWGVNNFLLQYGFFTSDTVNDVFGKIDENVRYLKGYSSIYNNNLPIESIDCSIDFKKCEGILVRGLILVLFTEDTIHLYQGGMLVQTITETNFGVLSDIRDVELVGNHLFVLDGNFLLKLEITKNPFQFKTFFGGYGGVDSEYKFRESSKIVYDSIIKLFYVLDVGNNIIKVYDKDLSFVKNIDAPNAVAVEGLAGVLYILYSDRVDIVDGLDVTSIPHNINTPSTIELDRVQQGFFWIGNGDGVYKYANNGLYIGRYKTNRKVSSFSRSGSTLFTVEDGDVYKNLDYQEELTITNDEELVYGFEDFKILPNELCWDVVLNDSLTKLYNTIDSFNLSIVNRFVSELDATSSVTGVSVEPVTPTGITTDCNALVSNDEVVSIHAWNRIMKNVYNLMLVTRDRLYGFDVFDPNLGGSGEGEDPYYVPLNWSVCAQSCDGVVPQIFDPNFTPLSLVELDNPVFHSVPTHPDGGSHLDSGACNTLSGGDCIMVNPEEPNTECER